MLVVVVVVGGVPVGWFLTDGKVKCKRSVVGQDGGRDGQECRAPRIERELRPTSGPAEQSVMQIYKMETILNYCHGHTLDITLHNIIQSVVT